MFFLLIAYVQAFELEILAGQTTFCFGEELSSQILIVGIIESRVAFDTLSVMVKSPLDQEIYSKNSTNFAKFSFTALESGTHSICVHNSGDMNIPVSLDIKTGVRAKDYSKIASTKEMKEIDYRVKMYEDLIKQIHSRMQVLREREEQMRNTNLTIHSRVISYSLCTVVLLIALAIVQILYLKKFFRAKKMI